MILAIKHIGVEGPGSIVDFFRHTARDLLTVDVSRQEPLPSDLKGVEALIVLGGPMGVYQEEEYPFLVQEDNLLKEALRSSIPVLGICLGSQLLAKACGAKVKKAASPEIGWKKVALTLEGRSDPLFSGLSEELQIFQWHEDTFDIPEGALLLAQGDDCRNQAFKIGPCAYGLQFHIEVTPGMVGSWVAAYGKDIIPEPEASNMLQESYLRQDEFLRQSDRICFNFSGIIEAAAKGK